MPDQLEDRRPRALIHVIWIAALVTGVSLLLGGCSIGDGDSGSDDSASFGDIPEVVEEVRPSVVAVLVEGPRGAGEGSGVIYDSGGLIVTNEHVVRAAQRIEVAFTSGEREQAEVRAADRLSDIAVLEVDRDDLPAPEFASEPPDQGELAVAIGNPLGFEASVTEGIVSGLSRSIPSGGQTPALVDLIQTSAPISPGNSGGALIGPDRTVVGINIAAIPPQTGGQSLGFAVPSTTVSDVVEQLLETGEVEHAFLGVQVGPITPTLAERFQLATEDGIVVVSVEPGSAADDAGIRPGDVIVRLGDREIRTPETLFAELRDHEPGEAVPLVVVRDGERTELEVTLASRPTPEDAQ